MGTMAFLANVEQPEVSCDCHAGPCPALPVKVELEEMHNAVNCNSSLPVNHPHGQWRPYHTHLLSPSRQRISLRQSSQLSQPISWCLYHRTS